MWILCLFFHCIKWSKQQRKFNISPNVENFYQFPITYRQFPHAKRPVNNNLHPTLSNPYSNTEVKPVHLLLKNAFFYFGE